MRPQLTISLLTSNRIPAIRRCLDSLVPILMQLPSELIIVNTSGSDLVQELVSQYTDHIIPFRWCNDFSKARNVGLHEARGEWFMFIDDDEWLENTEEIITFFCSGEYKHYNSAAYIQRNYLGWTGTEYLDAYVGRMVRLTPESKFVNTIHEYITPYIYPIKNFSAYVHHYGYVDGVIDAKTDRNIPLLKDELDKNRVTVHNYLQLCQEYLSVRQYVEAEEYAFKCLELEEVGKEKEKSWCLAYLPHLVYWQGDHERALEMGKWALRHPLCTEIAALFIYTALIAVCEKLGSMEKNIVVYAKNYHRGLLQLDERPEQWFLQSIGGLGEQQIKSVKDNACTSGFYAAVRIKDSESAKTFLRWLPWEDKGMENLYPIFHRLLQNEENKDFMFDLFNGLEVENPFILLIKAEAALKKGELEAAQKYNRAAVHNSNDFVRCEAVYLCMISQGELCLKPWMECMDIQQWTEITEKVASRAKIIELASWITELEKYMTDFPVRALSMLIVLQEKYLVEGILEINDRELLEKLKQYCGWVQKYTMLVYNDELMLSEHVHLLPQNFRFTLQIDQVFRDLERADGPSVLKGLRQAINTYEIFCGVIRRMLPIIEGEIGRLNQKDREFDTLGAQVKEVVRGLIQKGRLIDAMPLIQQLSSLMPKDLEVLRLRQKLYSDIK